MGRTSVSNEYRMTNRRSCLKTGVVPDPLVRKTKRVMSVDPTNIVSIIIDANYKPFKKKKRKEERRRREEKQERTELACANFHRREVRTVMTSAFKSANLTPPHNLVSRP